MTQNIAPDGYMPRIVDAQIERYLKIFCAVEIAGAKWCGKTWSARRRGASIAYLGQSATYATIAQDIYGAEENPQTLLTDARLANYLQLLKRLYLLEEVPGWAPPARSKKRFATKPKRYLADPSLAVAALGMSVQSLIEDWQTFGLVFENLCMRDLGVYARALPDVRPIPLRYYHDDSGLEADVIIELADGRWAAIEIKVGEDKVPAAIERLNHLEEKVCSNSRAQARPPEFKMVLVGVSEYARKAGERTYVVPVRLLGA